jgi:small subunit ribosomal protein S6
MKTDIAPEEGKKYELMVILNPDIGQDQLTKEIDEIKEMLAAKKGAKAEIFFEDVWGLRDMSYRIKKHERGFYAIFNFIMDPTLLRELDSNLRLEPNILRHMIVTLPFGYDPKSFAVVIEEEAKPAVEEKKPARKIVTTPKKEEETEKKIEEKPAVKEVKPETEEVEEKQKPAAPKAKKPETTLEDVDAKLKSIIENPDINF